VTPAFPLLELALDHSRRFVSIRGYPEVSPRSELVT